MDNDIVAQLRESIFLGNIHHAYAQTDGTYAFPNSREGDMLKQAVREFLAMREERDEARILACKGLALEARHTMDKIGSNIWKKTALTPQEMAEERGWDCFNKESN